MSIDFGLTKPSSNPIKVLDYNWNGIQFP